MKIKKIAQLSKYQGDLIYSSNGIAPTMPAQGGNRSKGSILIALVTPKLINMQSKSTKNISQPIKTMVMQQKLIPEGSQTLTLLLEDSLAKVSLLLESGEDSKIREALYSLKLLGLSKLKDLRFYYLRMLKDYSTTIKVIPLRQSFQPLMNWGMTVNGVCLTARISGSHRIGKECSLSDILEEQVDQK